MISLLPFYSAARWRTIKSGLNVDILRRIDEVATSPKWWFGLALVILAGLVFMPVVQVPRLPAWPFSKIELTTIPTTLRLQFNDAGAKPEEIERRNISWTYTNFDDRRPVTPTQKYVCDPPYVDAKGSAGISTLITQPSNCSYVDFPNFETVRNLTIFLSFTEPISAREIRLNSHGATLPKESHAISGNIGYVTFHGDVTRTILDIEVVN